MKKIFLLFLLSASGLFAVEHPITFVPGTDEPESFVTPGKPDGVKCVANEEGAYVFRINARGASRKIISSRRLKAKEGDILTLTLTLKVRSKGTGAAGFYLYHEKNGNLRPLPALYDMVEFQPEKKVYHFRKVIPRRKKAKSSDRPNTAVIFMDLLKGSDLDVEKIVYDVKSAPVKKKNNPPGKQQYSKNKK